MQNYQIQSKQLIKCFAAILLMFCAAWGSLRDGLAQGNAMLEIQGVVTALPAGQTLLGEWTVNGNIKVLVNEQTRLIQERGQVALGAFVEIKGSRSGEGVLTASSIEVKFRPGLGLHVHFRGAIEELPSAPNRIGDWKVGGKIIHVTQVTRLSAGNGTFAVGAEVEGEGLQMLDGSIGAVVITLKSSNSPNPQTKFSGIVEKLPSTEGRIGDWTVSGRIVHVTQATQLKQERAEVAVGSLVEVEGTRQSDGTFNATKIEVKLNPNNLPTAVRFKGTVETLPNSTGLIGEWKVSGRAVKVDDKTRIVPNVAAVKVGATVEIFGMKQGDGPVNALVIEVKDPNESDPNYIRFFGKVQALPAAANFVGEWKVDEKTVVVSAATKLNQERGAITVNAFVEVKGLKQADGKINATEIEVKAGAPTGFVRFLGVIETLPATKIGDWVVSKRTIHVTDKTKINEERKPVAVGAFVHIEGNLRTDGSIDALEIEVKAHPATSQFVSFIGTIKTLPTAANKVGDWNVSDRTVHVTAETKLNQERGQIAVGALVEVKGTLRTDGSVDATSIEVKSTTGGPTPPSFVELMGKITALPNSERLVGEWKIDDKTIRVSSRTAINRERGPVALGATVKVKGLQIGTSPIDAFFIEVQASATATDFAAYTPLTSVSASSYLADSAGDSIIAAFGSGLARGTATATSLPLPIELNGVSVSVDGHPAGLFFVSPTQINYLVPAGLPPGKAQVTVEVNDEVVALGTLTINDVAPSLFTADASGKGAPAGVVLRVNANGQQSYEPLVRFEGGKAQPVTIVRRNGEAVYLLLFGAGLRAADNSDGNAANGVAENVTVTIGGVSVPVLFAGKAPGFAGLDQLNLQLTAGVPAGANLSLVLTVNDGDGNLLTANVVTISVQ
jgi:uncharacterized protein (TIGR03437 family)